MAEIAFTQQAISDIDEIATFISHDSSHYAKLQVVKFLARCEMLENFPAIGRIVPELNIKSIREIFEGNYRIIYKITDKDTVHILTIHYSRKLLKKSDLKQIIRTNK
jgi:toxin ParE1/3/4